MPKVRKIKPGETKVDNHGLAKLAELVEARDDLLDLHEEDNDAADLDIIRPLPRNNSGTKIVPTTTYAPTQRLVPIPKPRNETKTPAPTQRDNYQEEPVPKIEPITPAPTPRDNDQQENSALAADAGTDTDSDFDLEFDEESRNSKVENDVKLVDVEVEIEVDSNVRAKWVEEMKQDLKKMETAMLELEAKSKLMDPKVFNNSMKFYTYKFNELAEKINVPDRYYPSGVKVPQSILKKTFTKANIRPEASAVNNKKLQAANTEKPRFFNKNKTHSDKKVKKSEYKFRRTR